MYSLDRTLASMLISSKYWFCHSLFQGFSSIIILGWYKRPLDTLYFLQSDNHIGNILLYYLTQYQAHSTKIITKQYVVVQNISQSQGYCWHSATSIQPT